MPEGTPVLAAHYGIVVEVKNTPTGYGKHIRLVSPQLPDGNYWYTVYGHLGDIFVKVGQEVKAGDEIALESNTGFVISGGNQYWGNAPNGKGVHLHFGFALLGEPVAGEQISYLGKAYSRLNYNNGLFGYLDPFTIGFEEDKPQTKMLDLYKEAGREATYAKINGKYYWISPNAMPDLAKVGLAKWEDVKTIPEKIIQEGVIA